MQHNPETFNMQRALGALRRRAPWIVLCCVLATAAAYAYSKHQTRQYTAIAAVAFNYNSLNQQIAGLPGESSTALATQQVDNLELVKLGDMAARTASLLGHGLTAEQVAAAISVATQGESTDVDVSATMASPVLATAVVNTYVREFVAEQRSSNRKYFTSALALVNKQLATLKPAQRSSPAALTLQQRAQALSLLSELDYNNVEVAQEAAVPVSPSSPKTSKNTLIGGALGLLLGLGLAFMLERLDQKIRRPEELEEIYGAQLLGVVPNSPALRRAKARNGVGATPVPPAEAEAFNLIRAHLRFLNIGRDVHMIAIASATAGDGKTTIARHLAEAAARSGARALLIEVDLRHPTLAHQLAINQGPGLVDVLIGEVPLEDAIQEINVGLPAGDGIGSRTLAVLTAGTLMPLNPGELLENPAVDALFARVRSTYDFVVIDTPSLATVSDAFSLLTKVDGVVIAGRVGMSRRDIAERLHQLLATSGVRVLGAIANGAKTAARPYALVPGNATSPTVSVNDASPSEQLISAPKS